MRVDGQEPDMRRKRRTSGQRIAKSISIKGAKRRFGDCAWKATELTPGDPRRVPSLELRKSRGFLTAAQKSAEGIIGQAIGKASEALQRRKGGGTDGQLETTTEGLND